MKTNRPKVKREKKINQRYNYGTEHLKEYLAEFTGIKRRCKLINCHSLSVCADQSLQVYTSRAPFFERSIFHPYENYTFDCRGTDIYWENLQFDDDLFGVENYVEPTDINGMIRTNLKCSLNDGNRSLGFAGDVEVGGSLYSIIFLSDVSHHYNSFGRKIFEQLEGYIANRWDEVGNPVGDGDATDPETEQVSLGMDAEFELYKTGSFVSADDYFDFEGEIGSDGARIPLELRPKPAMTGHDLLANVKQLMNIVYKDGFAIDTEGNNTAIGCHIHFGSELDFKFVTLLDNWIAKKLWHLNGKARNSYKCFSATRGNKPHGGWEYRSLPAAILKDKPLAELVLKIIEGLARDFYNGGEVSVNPLKEDYLNYLTESEWGEWRLRKRGNVARFDEDSWGCKRRGALITEFEMRYLDIPIYVKMINTNRAYQPLQDYGFWCLPHNVAIEQFMMNELGIKISGEVGDYSSNRYYMIRCPLVTGERSRFIDRFESFLNNSSLEDIPKL